mgnify:CR=1 FL=1
MLKTIFMKNILHVETHSWAFFILKMNSWIYSISFFEYCSIQLTTKPKQINVYFNQTGLDEGGHYYEDILDFDRESWTMSHC